MLCRTYEEPADGLALPGKFMSLTPRSAGSIVVASVIIMCVFETIESLEITETELALDRDGETQGSLVLQDTIRCGMGEDV
jgi:hypothetical protein